MSGVYFWMGFVGLLLTITAVCGAAAAIMVAVDAKRDWKIALWAIPCLLASIGFAWMSGYGFEHIQPQRPLYGGYR